MNKLFLILLTFIFGLVFLISPITEPIDLFLFSDIKITVQTHIYFICEKLVLVILAWIIAAESKEYRTALQVFFWLVVVDFIDYIFTYNSIWFRLYGFPISMNIMKVAIFGFVVSREWIKIQSDR